jgi:UDP-N-acetylmuramoyl-L-alanyl-D-glutamate--2,6-diaminopimelate ligase
MLLRSLFSELHQRIDLSGIPDVEITGVCDDSRRAMPGDLFIARDGVKVSGATFLEQAVERGAAAVLVGSRNESCGVPQVVVSDPSAMAFPLAHAFHHHPAKAIKVVGVTGTNGKTTTTFIIRHLLQKVGRRCGLIGTVEVDDGAHPREAEMTTPGAIELAGLLGAMRNNGCAACAMEVSSHALHQGRVSGMNFAGAGFTNLTGDHLDYHETMENYAAAKAILFEMLPEESVAVVNADDAASDRMVERCEGRVIRFGFSDGADYQARDIAISSQGSRFILHTPDGRAEVQTGVIGRHNIANSLTAAALVGEVFGLSVHQISAGLRDAQGAPGRLQAIRCGQPFAVLVDYAHTDDALANVLSSLRSICRGKLRVLFGCGGDRDVSKRPRMARAAEECADAVYVTSDNPRTEDPEEIIAQIVAGFREPERVYVEADRRTAIRQILGDAGPRDTVLIAGKGHENYQILGLTKHHFDDVEEAMQALQESGSEA